MYQTTNWDLARFPTYWQEPHWNILPSRSFLGQQKLTFHQKLLDFGRSANFTMRFELLDSEGSLDRVKTLAVMFVR